MKSFTPKNRSEVDIRVAQEIKNHRDVIASMDQRISDLSHALVSISVSREKEKKNYAAEVQDLKIAVENHSYDYNVCLQVVHKKMSELEQILQRITSNVKDVSAALVQSYVPRHCFDNVIAGLERWLCEDNIKHTLKSNDLDHSLSQLKAQVESHVKEIHEKIKPVELEVDPLASIHDKIDVYKVDLQGAFLDIERLKKQVAYGEKKFENIYTLLERLKQCPKQAQ